MLSIARTQVQLFAELDFCGVSKKNCIFLNIFHKDFSTKLFCFHLGGILCNSLFKRKNNLRLFFCLPLYAIMK